MAPITKAGEDSQFKFDFDDEKQINYLENKSGRSKSQGHSSEGSDGDGGQAIYNTWRDDG